MPESDELDPNGGGGGGGMDRAPDGADARADARAPDGADARADARARRRRAADALRRTNRKPGVLRAVRATRELLPGDARFGDQLSTAGDHPSAVVGRYLASDARAADGTASREAGMAMLQVWQALSERVGRGAGTVSATIVFTDLVGFSSWVLEVGDELALELLREVASVVEPLIERHHGRVVKRLGDGHMAVFGEPRAGVDAALALQDGIGDVEVAGHRPRLRAGVHVGTPRKLGSDYLGTDVNVAARVGAAAGPGEVLITDAVLAQISVDGLEVKRRRGFRAKGAPPELEVYSVARGAGGSAV
jgi:adenylate cyclase